ncbi:hypothetical protein CP532_0555 [Ophiocordyceps camponoti-leonardi (nom. inval.)]|nr:hypothetical protein CP532_0555 [Ophiocordyceps camponoti-leonardi (nom. inval.)]
MPASRAKRPFAGAAADASQRQITSFFSSSSSTSDAGAQQSSSVAPSVRLPPSVQADLLSVGMRVRKSVPEGYKTASSSSFKLWSDDGDGGKSSGVASRHEHGHARTLAHANADSRRELLPFCGINRVGGLAFQDDPSYLAPETLPGLTLSQETIDEDDDDEDDSDKILKPPRKRSLPEDEEEDEWSLPGQAYTPGWSSANARVKATPRHRAAAKRAGGEAEDVGQENMMVDGDFGDADFLVYVGAEQEMDLSR